MADVRRILDEGRAHLWIGGRDSIEVAVVAQLMERPRQKLYLIWLAGGSGLDTCKAIEEAMRGYAKAEGCDVMEIVGRSGWERALEGYERHVVVMRRKV